MFFDCGGIIPLSCIIFFGPQEVFYSGSYGYLSQSIRNDMSRTVVAIAAEKNNNNNNNNNNQTKYIKVFPLEKGKTLIIKRNT